MFSYDALYINSGSLYFDEFCKRLTGTSTDAGSETRRKEIVSYAETFSGFVQETATNLKSLQEEANEKIKPTPSAGSFSFTSTLQYSDN